MKKKEGIRVPQNNKIKRFPAVLSGLLFLSAGVLKVLIPYESPLQSVAFVYRNLQKNQLNL